MLLIALVIGTSVTVSATERVTIPLVLGGTIAWSFVPGLQLLTGLLLVRGIDGGRARALDQYFATHWPWSLWILGFHGLVLMWPPIRALGLLPVATAVVPMIMTFRLLLSLGRQHLGLSGFQVWRRVALHQGVTYLLVLGYVSFAVALWPRLIGLFR
jgi:hypothetical protein